MHGEYKTLGGKPAYPGYRTGSGPTYTPLAAGDSHLRRLRRRARAVPTAPAATATVAPAATFFGSGSDTGGGSSLTPSSSVWGGRPTYRPVLGGVKRAT